MTVNQALTALVNYAEKEGLIEKEDGIYALNSVLGALSLDSFEPEECGKPALEEILACLLDDACERGVCEDSVVFRDIPGFENIPFSQIGIIKVQSGASGAAGK